MRTSLNQLSAAVAKRLSQQEERSNQGNVQSTRVSAQSGQASQIKATASASMSTAKAPSSGGSSRTPVIDPARIAGLVPQRGDSTSKNASTDSHIPISDVTGSRGFVSQRNKAQDDGSGNSGSSGQAPHIPISVVTGSRDITTVSPQLRAYLQQGSPAAATAIPQEYADLANLLDKASSGTDFSNWADMTAKQQQSAVQNSGLSQKDQLALLNAAPHYVETIAKVQDVFANRYELGLTVADARNIAKELFTLADERDEAINRTGKYENDAVFAPKALRWLDEQESELLDGLGKNTNETGRNTWYNGGNPDLAVRAARRASYADIDDASATNQIESLIMKNMQEARTIAFLSNANKFTSELSLMLWFYSNVKAGASMDYKNQIIWDKALPGLPYPEEDKVYYVFGIKVSSSDLGNLNYALVGKALGIPESLLLQQAGAAQLRDHPEHSYANELEKFVVTQKESMQKRDQWYGDEKDDYTMILNGFNVYKSLF